MECEFWFLFSFHRSTTNPYCYSILASWKTNNLNSEIFFTELWAISKITYITLCESVTINNKPKHFQLTTIWFIVLLLPLLVHSSGSSSCTTFRTSIKLICWSLMFHLYSRVVIQHTKAAPWSLRYTWHARKYVGSVVTPWVRFSWLEGT